MLQKRQERSKERRRKEKIKNYSKINVRLQYFAVNIHWLFNLISRLLGATIP